MPRKRWLFTMGIGFTALAVSAQAPSIAAPRHWAFEVVSIKANKDGGPQRFGPTPDGYEMRSLFFEIPIMTAYKPQTGGSQLFTSDEFPDWVKDDAYDIDAKVSAADLPDWHDPVKQPEMLRAMLQTMLAERLKLVVHRAQKEGNVYEMVVAKGGPKFKQTDPAASHPGRFTMPDGSVIGPELMKCTIITHYWEITMPMVASFVMSAANRPVVDKTGLTGRYDLQRETPLPSCAPEGSDPEAAPSVFTFAEGLGLKLVPAKGQVETLVIDHVEKPTEN